MTILDRLRSQAREYEPEKGVNFMDLVRPLWNVVADGDIDTDDYDELVAALKEIVEETFPLIDIPWVPDRFEPIVDRMLIPLFQGLCEQAVQFAYERFNIPLPEGV